MSGRAKVLFIAIALVIGLFKLVDRAAEYLWLEALGYESVFWTIRLLQIGLFVFAFVLVFAYLWINFLILAGRLDLRAVASEMRRQLAGRTSQAGQTGQAGPGPSLLANLGLSGAGVRLPILVLVVVIALVFGLVFAGHWDSLLRFHWSEIYGEAEPVYGRDIGFYLFELPIIELIQNGLLVASLIGSAIVVATYLYGEALRIGWRRGVEASREVLWHVAANLVLFLVALAWGYYLDRFALLQSTDGVVYGVGYTDFHVVRPALWIMVGATLGLAAALLLPRLLRRPGMAILVVGAYLAISVVCLMLAPWAVQGFAVEPNELELERPFLRHNIAFTRKAFDLDRIEERSHGAAQVLTSDAVSRNSETIDNVRLWDWRPLSQTFRQLQQIRLYYEFNDIGVDRYLIDGAYRQVMLSARELSDRLPGKADTWVNRRLQFTHGYGLVMGLTAEKSDQGTPVLTVKDLPPKTTGGLTVTEPAIYYGETMSGYRIVPTSVEEFDYPKGDENVYANYAGRGGVRLDSFWKRLLFAWHQFDAGILLTSYLTPESRIQLWRGVDGRVRRIAPFLRRDADPYLVLSAGRLYWIQDTYTISSGFPYAEPYGDAFNYIRNSVKVVIDAYDGDVHFYVVDPGDPILRVYRKALPSLFRDVGELSADLRNHLRYPQELFEAQVAKYSIYHMTVPQVFYNGEDMWAAPFEKYGGEQILMKPYYVLMKLPDEARLEFLLMTPMTPINRDNMIAWIAARNDFPGYGELIVYKLPKERLIFGPIQVEALIDQDTDISRQLSLWDQRGSRVIRGNLIVIPIEQSFLYVEPVYLVAEGTNIPQLKRVIVAAGDRVAMEPTLTEALANVFGERFQRTVEPPTAAQTGTVAAARAALKAAQDSLAAGDWDAFGRAMQQLNQILGD